MLDHILELKRKVSWVFGDVTCALYPITNIDTVSQVLKAIHAIDIVAKKGTERSGRAACEVVHFDLVYVDGKINDGFLSYEQILQKVV